MYKVDKNLISSISILYKNKRLIISLTRRDILQRYQGSLLGVFWSILTPIVMLAIYTFIFSVVFKAKWGIGGDKYQFSMLLFSGLILFNFFSDILSRSPELLVSHSNYVTKVIFPVEILPWVITLSALFNFILSFIIWFIFYTLLIGLPALSVIFTPAIVIPFCFLCCGLSYIISATGVYLKDTNQLVALLVTAMMFLTPIFYPISALPEKYQVYMYLNPITNVIEMFRDIAIYNNSITLNGYAIYFFSSAFIYLLGFLWFQKLRKGFSDVL
ncbi:ABC-2 type transporter permease protein [Psychromonas ingrahamii 37]|uniref:Transport permease protein n=1 Tax=Psychromonas ingrahamii (strain DSM 17664 / CCUG 51855 / 37) TaxID=357804 RepID=A1T079_PSYIN|nr:ABC transporter permease [Psychromonas ingrahamii]ABM05144.1 ABC-2 type transporter permease protein [Psychromonas ingrahamii 37]